MKTFLFILTLLISTSPLLAQTQSNLARQVKSAMHQGQLPKQERETRQATPNAGKAALQRLKTLQDPKNWKPISWQEFLKLNKHTKEVEHVSIDLDMMCQDRICKVTPAPIPLEAIQQKANSEPDYKTFIAGQKLIFVGEAMNHNTKRAPRKWQKFYTPYGKQIHMPKFCSLQNF